MVEMVKPWQEIGPERPEEIMRGHYTGDEIALVGYSAYISPAPFLPRGLKGWYVQEDNQEGKYAYGWWWFPESDWEVTPEGGPDA